MLNKILMFTCSIVMFVLLMGPSYVYGQQGRIGYWKFDESSGTTAVDLAGGDNNGTLENAVQFQPDAGRTGGLCSMIV